MKALTVDGGAVVSGWVLSIATGPRLACFLSASRKIVAIRRIAFLGDDDGLVLAIRFSFARLADFGRLDIPA